VESQGAPTVAALGAARVTWASLSLADKLDTLVGLFLAGERPTGSRDPFGMRRQAHGLLRILLDAESLTGIDARPSLGALLTHAQSGFEGVVASTAETWSALEDFVRERLTFVLQQRGAAPRNVRAVLGSRSLTDLRPIDIERNLQELPAFAETASFRQLAEAFKRVRNIARELKSADGAAGTGTLKEAAELALAAELDKREAVIHEAVRTGRNFRAAYAEASGVEPAVARFFNEVFVMTDDPALRDARLRLMKRLEQLILQLGDISEIVAPES
jgi:glycyl-tRNA synthetase beta chain